ncbi:hypothetical protein ACPUBP_00675 [Methylococcus capsulatus]|uniref:hypothetical protein n=1 Tax=Methylococcus capsulatus TaxID=414 RepID=UPI003CF44869
MRNSADQIPSWESNSSSSNAPPRRRQPGAAIDEPIDQHETYEAGEDARQRHQQAGLLQHPGFEVEDPQQWSREQGEDHGTERDGLGHVVRGSFAITDLLGDAEIIAFVGSREQARRISVRQPSPQAEPIAATGKNRQDEGGYEDPFHGLFL